MSFRITLKETVQLIVAMHGLRWHQERPVLARLKQMQRLGFPRLPTAGRGGQSTFNLTDILLIAAAFELMEGGLVTYRAVTLVSGSCDEVLASLLRAARSAGAAREREEEAYVAFPRNLEAIGPRGAEEPWPDDHLVRIELTSASPLTPLTGAEPALLIFPSRIMKRLLSSPVLREPIETALEAFGS